MPGAVATMPPAAATIASAATPAIRTRSRRLTCTCRRACSGALRCSAAASPEPASRKSRSTRLRSGVERSRHSTARANRTPRYTSLSGRPIASQVSAAAATCRQMRCPSTSSSSHSLSRGQARASASWANSTLSSSVVTNRASTSVSMSCSRSSSVATTRRRTRARTGSPSGFGATSRSIEVANHRSALRVLPARRPARRTAPPRHECRLTTGSQRRSACSLLGVPRSGATRATASATSRALPRRHARAGRQGRARGSSPACRAGASTAARSCSSSILLSR